jgi:hypothetical protein
VARERGRERKLFISLELTDLEAGHNYHGRMEHQDADKLNRVSSTEGVNCNKYFEHSKRAYDE